jgi:hypothetical protein
VTLGIVAVVLGPVALGQLLADLGAFLPVLLSMRSEYPE